MTSKYPITARIVDVTILIALAQHTRTRLFVDLTAAYTVRPGGLKFTVLLTGSMTKQEVTDD